MGVNDEDASLSSPGFKGLHNSGKSYKSKLEENGYSRNVPVSDSAAVQ